MPDSQNNLNRPFSLAIDLIRLDIAQPVDEVAIKNVYVDVDDTHIRIAAFDFKSEISADGLIVKLPPTTLGSVYEVRLLSQGSAVLSAYFEMPKDDCFLSDLPLYTAFPPRESYPVDVVNWGDIKGSLENQSDLLEKVFSVSDADNLKVKLDDDFKILNKDISNQKLDTGITATAKFGGVERILADKNAEIISVKDFGAKGDGVTNDSQAIKQAILAGFKTGKAVYIPSSDKPYMVRKNIIKFVGTVELSDSKSLTVYGDGESSLIKMFDGEVTEKYSNLIRFELNQSFNSFLFKDFKLDHNASGSAAPTNDWAYEQSHTISFAAGTGHRIESIIYDSLVIDDPAADGYNHAYAGRVGKIHYKNPIERNRTRKRSSIQETYCSDLTIIDNPYIYSIESEPTVEAKADSRLIVNGGVVTDMDIGVKGNNFKVNVDINKTVVENKFNIGGTAIIRVDSAYLKINKDWNRIQGHTDIKFNKCTIAIHYERGVSYPLRFTRTDRKPANCEFYKCDFIFDSDDEMITTSASLVDNKNGTAISNEDTHLLTYLFEECTFDERATTAIRLDRMGTVNLKNNTYSGTEQAILWADTSTATTRVTIDGGDFSKVTGLGFKSALTNNPESLITLKGDWVGQNALSWDSISGNFSSFGGRIFNTRVSNLVDALPSSALAGDRINTTSDTSLGSVTQYICTSTSKSSAEWVCSKQAGIASYQTDSLPLLTPNDVGARAIDSTLNKTVTWTGAAWI